MELEIPAFSFSRSLVLLLVAISLVSKEISSAAWTGKQRLFNFKRFILLFTVIGSVHFIACIFSLQPVNSGLRGEKFTLTAAHSGLQVWSLRQRQRLTEFVCVFLNQPPKKQQKNKNKTIAHQQMIDHWSCLRSSDWSSYWSHFFFFFNYFLELKTSGNIAEVEKFSFKF